MVASMIPYDDLVAALSQWRARQGLPVSTLGGGGSGGTPSPGSGPHGKPPSGPHSSRPGMAAARADSEVEELDAEAYEEGGQYGGYGNDAEPTSMGSAPERPTDSDMGRGGRDDW
jgi:hypothetical protein